MEAAAKAKITTVAAYLADVPEARRPHVEALRQAVLAVAPQATETISYQMPTFQLHGALVYYAVCKNHLGFYPTSTITAALKAELAAYKTTKGSIHFPFDKPIPVELVQKIVRIRMGENEEKAALKAGKMGS